MKLKLYLTLNYVKYIFLILAVFIFIIWLAQIIRFIDFGQAFTLQVYEIIKITSFLLPSAVNTILPIIIYLSSCFYNRHINSTNEITIFQLYLSKKKINIIIFLFYGLISVLYILNSEVISVKSYNAYKTAEIDFRNNFQIKDQDNHINITNKIDLFYESKKEDQSTFINVIAFLIDENILIKSNEVLINLSENQISFKFINGQRISASSNEESFTNFDKLDYKIIKEVEHKISFGKENFTAIQLFKSDNPFFEKSAHRRIIDLFFLIFVIFISNKIIYLNSKSNSIIIVYTYNLVSILLSFTILSLVSKFFLSDKIDVLLYYIISTSFMVTTYLLLRRKYAFL